MNRQLQADILEAMPPLQLRMIYKFGVHAGKGPWTNKTLSEAVIKLHDEVKELDQAVAGGASYEEIMDECADVSNMALIISHIVSRIGPKPPDPVYKSPCGYIASTMSGRCELPMGHKDGHEFSHV